MGGTYDPFHGIHFVRNKDETLKLMCHIIDVRVQVLQVGHKVNYSGVRVTTLPAVVWMDGWMDGWITLTGVEYGEYHYLTFYYRQLLYPIQCMYIKERCSQMLFSRPLCCWNLCMAAFNAL
jgi:hypothetical protein